ncbi:IclR family transcriptional regulator [Tropicimonas isoalkanivorans]|uniref:Transcriptional regulator, IclR family n=1 Tax=Tropicimonas isoalkanivorans TaxID=441112 RepID=A0A1I1DGV8_9RHOB|nr:IclR family transcriptional regulator [Tropicimonas isoalkanivorans]SFB73612.1 transcriptional regulator, IclR family [Tropicimonas isoalkanivorans]
MSQSTPKPQTRTKERGLERAFLLLDYLCAAGAPQRPIEIATGMGAPKSSIYELVGLLTTAGVLERTDAEGRVFLGRKLHFWGVNYLKGFDVTRHARPVLEGITAKTRETSQLCMLDGDKYYVAMMNEGSRPFRISSDVGERTPIPWTASGRLLLGHLSDDEILDLIPPDDFTYSNGGSIAPRDFIASVRKAWAEKFFSFDSVADNFTHCFAAPVLDADGLCQSTVCIVAPKEDAMAHYADYRAALVEAGRELSRRLDSREAGRNGLAAE